MSTLTFVKKRRIGKINVDTKIKDIKVDISKTYLNLSYPLPLALPETTLSI